MLCGLLLSKVPSSIFIIFVMPKVCLTIFSCVIYKYNITFILFKAVYYETVVKNKLKRTWYSIFYSCMSANVNRPFKLYKKVNWVPFENCRLRISRTLSNNNKVEFLKISFLWSCRWIVATLQTNDAPRLTPLTFLVCHTKQIT